jgi:hypothetical protein
MREGSIPESIARQLVGRNHATGSFVSYESRGGKVTLTSRCSNCTGSHANISVANASQAASNPSTPLINCQWCKRVIEAPKAQTYEDVLAIPESRRSSAQQRIVVEAENAQRIEARTAAKQVPNPAQAAATRAIKSSLWDQREKYLQTVAHTEGAQFVSDPRVVNSASFVSWQDWQLLSSESLAEINAGVDAYLEANGLR